MVFPLKGSEFMFSRKLKLCNQPLRIFRIHRRLYPITNVVRTYQYSRLFIYVLERKGEHAVVLYERNVQRKHLPTISEYSIIDGETMQQRYISKEEYQDLRPKDDNPLIANVYELFLKRGHLHIWVVDFQNPMQAYGVVIGEDEWPWQNMQPEEKYDFKDFLIYYQIENTPKKSRF